MKAKYQDDIFERGLSMLTFQGYESNHTRNIGGPKIMIHIGIDHHKRYSHAVAIDDAGTVCWDDRLSSDRDAFQSLKESLPPGEPVQSVLEAGRNWGILYDALEELEMNPILANPLKMRLIAETFTKTDKIDATTHAVILKAGLTPRVHVPPKEVRDQKYLLRQRFWLVKLQTAHF